MLLHSPEQVRNTLAEPLRHGCLVLEETKQVEAFIAGGVYSSPEIPPTHIDGGVAGTIAIGLETFTLVCGSGLSTYVLPRQPTVISFEGPAVKVDPMSCLAVVWDAMAHLYIAYSLQQTQDMMDNHQSCFPQPTQGRCLVELRQAGLPAESNRPIFTYCGHGALIIGIARSLRNAGPAPDEPRH